MERLNNLNNFTALLKNKDILLPVQHLKAVKCAVTLIIYVDLDIDIKSGYPKESSLLDHVYKASHCIILVLNTAVVNKNRHFSNLMVLTV